MIARLLFVFAALAFALTSLQAQSPAPVIVQAMPATTAPAVAAAPAATVESSQSAVKFLQEIKAANEAILTKQAATLQQLDEIEKAAEQLKIYSKRG